ncbi:MAG: Alanine-tRNA ligase [Parcubacteria group bacterium GW2011_GWA2_38_13]|nr:MAG: Alanine-tRNA ligase [Parcubacteria group bacterium GW2011_GWA2_38_13]
MTSQELREKYLQYFKSKGHAIIPSASLIPDNDPSVLFTTAGMHPLIPYLLGGKHPEGKKLCNVQKCVRTGDIDEVGNTTHHTFFEMLGNWSLGDYFKNEAIEMSFNFLTKELHLPLDRLACSVFEGDNDAPRDNESADIWEKLGVSKDRIAYLPKDDNWWGPAGTTGPCGPDSEMFYWTDDTVLAPKKFDSKDKRWVEIWNDVFMQYNKNKDEKYSPLEQKNVDTGMGLERTLAVLNNLNDNYLTDLFQPIIKKIEEIFIKKYDDTPEVTRAMRIIADHIRSATFILGDEKGIAPSNVDQGYILRRLIRRAIRYGKQLGIKEVFTFKIAEVIIEKYKNVYPELQKNKEFIINQLISEEEKFSKTLGRGLREFEKMKEIKGVDAFNLFQSYGFPLEMIEEEAKKRNLLFGEKEKNEFENEFKKHQELSRTASAGKFKGGLADASVNTTKGHTATHLLLAALRKVLGEHVFQKGSNITPQRIRLDFSHNEKLSSEQISSVENLVNTAIQKNMPITMEEVSLEEAKNIGAMGVFEQKYQNKVKVYTIGDFSKEICGGPHILSTGELKSFKIIQETASSAGVRRIKAVVGK